MRLQLVFIATLLLMVTGLEASEQQGPGLVISEVKQVVSEIENKRYTGIDSLLLYRNGQLLSENYFNGFQRQQLHQTRSTFKSITGLLAAIAFDKGWLTANELVMPLLATYVKQPLAAGQETLRVKHLLNMSSGLNCSEMPGTGPYHEEAVDNGPSPLRYSLSIAMALEPGKSWQYCNANSFLLGAVISAALKRAKQPDIFAFANTHLFSALGIKDYEIYQSPDGFLYAQGNARFRPVDLAKIGLLVLNHGQWRGKQIISGEHIENIFKGEWDIAWSWTDAIKSHPQGNARYAYQWYRTEFVLEDKVIAASHTWGNGGQFVFVLPDLDMVIVFTGSNYGDIHQQKQVFEIMHKYLLPAMLADGEKNKAGKQGL